MKKANSLRSKANQKLWSQPKKLEKTWKLCVLEFCDNQTFFNSTKKLAKKKFSFQTDFLFLPDVWRATAAAAAAAAALVRAAGKRLEPTLATFDFGDTAKLVRFVSSLRYLKWGQYKNVDFFETKGQSTLDYRAAKLENRQTRSLPKKLEQLWHEFDRFLIESVQGDEETKKKQIVDFFVVKKW